MIRTCAAMAIAATLFTGPAQGLEETVRSTEPTPQDAAAAQDTAAAAQTTGRVAREAGFYALYHEDVRDLQDREFAVVGDIDTALNSMVSHTPDRFARAWVAYSALVAAQTPSFVDGVRETADYYGREAVLTGFRNDPSYATTFAGADQARQAILKSATADASTVRRAGAVVKQRAYSLQRQDWAKKKSGDNSDRLAQLNSAALSPRPLNASVVTALNSVTPRGAAELDAARDQELASFWGVFRLGPASAQAASFGGSIGALDMTPHPNYRGALNQSVTLAAFAALGSQDEAPVGSLLQDPGTQSCVRTARIQFDSCIAATNFRYEDPFCIAEHAMTDVGACLAKIAGR